MQKKDKVLNTKLDPEEAEILDSIERGEWKTVPDFAIQKKRAEEAAADYLVNNTSINIRLSQQDLDRLHLAATNKGLSSEALIATILHDYISKAL